jgi:hypothetical protein
MEVRGRRECKACGTEWSYYETGRPECPECGSPYSVGIGDRERHTDRPADLDLEAALTALSASRYREAAEAAEAAAGEYVRRRGFISAGSLRPLADPYLAASEIRHVAGHLRTALMAGEQTDLEYVRDLFEAAQAGERPPPEAVPAGLAAARGLGVADAVDDYRAELRTHLEERDSGPDIAGPLDRLDAHVRRVRALDGAVDPARAETLVSAARAIGDLAGGERDPAAVERVLDALENRT